MSVKTQTHTHLGAAVAVVCRGQTGRRGLPTAAAAAGWRRCRRGRVERDLDGLTDGKHLARPLCFFGGGWVGIGWLVVGGDVPPQPGRSSAATVCAAQRARAHTELRGRIARGHSAASAHPPWPSALVPNTLRGEIRDASVVCNPRLTSTPSPVRVPGSRNVIRAPPPCCCCPSSLAATCCSRNWRKGEPSAKVAEAL